MRSALTSALAGNAQPPPKREETAAPLALLSDPAFPCLRHAKGEVVEAVQSSGGYEEADVATMSLPGTAPSSSLKKGMVRALRVLPRDLEQHAGGERPRRAAADARSLSSPRVRSAHGAWRRAPSAPRGRAPAPAESSQGLR